MPVMSDHLCQAYPALRGKLSKIALADLPTRVEQRSLTLNDRPFTIAIKRDDETSAVYGGNKVRKLEYLLARALDRGSRRVATFGSVASNHALATALHAKSVGLGATCFLSHQTKTAKAALTLNALLDCGAEIVRFSGTEQQRTAIIRGSLRGRRATLIPMGGSNWLGVVGFVNAGLELAAQVDAGETPPPQRLYVANGTMATVAGLALGLAAAGLETEVQAVRVTHKYVATPTAMSRLMHKTVTLLNRLDASMPAHLADTTRIRFRDSFFGEGYAHPTEAGERAIRLAEEQLGITLDSTYTGKAMAALLHDLQKSEYAGQNLLFWNTYTGTHLPVTAERPRDTSTLPAEFLRYFD